MRFRLPYAHNTLDKREWIKRPLNLVILILGGRLKTLQKHEGTSSSGLAMISHSLQHPPTVGIPTKEKINKRCSLCWQANSNFFGQYYTVRNRTLSTLKPMKVTCPEATYIPFLDTTMQETLLVWPCKKVCFLLSSSWITTVHPRG